MYIFVATAPAYLFNRVVMDKIANNAFGNVKQSEMD